MGLLNDISRFVRGVNGISKVALNIDRVPMETTIMRRHLCSRCPKLTTATSTWPLHGKFGPHGCAECRCFIGPKTLLAGESCPLKKW